MNSVAHADWAEPVQRVAEFLQQAAVEARLEEFDVPTPTAMDAARAAGCKLGQIVKSLVFDCDGRQILALVPGDRRADVAKIAAAGGCRFARIASEEEVRDATGFEAGAVAPFPLPRIERVFLDGALLAHASVWIGAGSPKHLAVLSPSELARLTRAEVIDLTE